MSSRVAKQMLTFLVSAMILTGTAFGQVRPDAPGPMTELPREFVDELFEAWNACRNPTILVMFGVVSGRTIEYGVRESNVDTVQTRMANQLLRAFPNGVVALDVAQAREGNLLDALRRDIGDAIAPNAELALAERFNANIIVDVQLLPGNRPGEYVPSMRAVDTRNSRIIATGSLVSSNFTATTRHGHVFGTRLAEQFGEGFLRVCGGVEEQTYRVLILASQGEEMTPRQMRRVANRIEDDVRRVRWVEVSETLDGRDRFSTLEIRYRGRLTRLLNDIEDDVLSQLNLGWTIQSLQQTDAVAYLYSAERPAWHILTDINSDAFAEQVRQRRIRLGTEGRPRLGIIVADQLDDATGAFGIDAERVSTSFTDDQLQGSLSNMFVDLGFQVVERAELVRQMKGEAELVERYRNLPHLADALAALDGVDMVLHVNVNETAGDQRMNTRLYDVKRARFVGHETWPNASANRLSRYPVSEQSPSAVARFLAGRLIERWDRMEVRNVSTLAVRVQNVTDVQDVVALTEMLNDLPVVAGISDLQLATPLASFELLTDKTPVALIASIADAIGAWRPGTQIQVLGHTLMFNLQPKILDPSQQGERVDDPAAEQTLQRALSEARESVCVIGLRHLDEFVPVGTGWLVSEKRLATNAHVVVGLFLKAAEILDNGIWNFEDIQFVARSGPDVDQEMELKLGRTWVHPEYVRYQERYMIPYLLDMYERQGLDPNSPEARAAMGDSGFIGGFDVGLIEILEGKAGPPLAMADNRHVYGLSVPAKIGYAGFPMENVPSARDKPVLAVHYGWISAMTGFDHQHGAPERNYLIHSDLQATGGASGSPILDGSGKVIAVLSSGSVVGTVAVRQREEGQVDLRNVRIFTGFTYGQRIDLVSQMLSDRRQEVTWENIVELFASR